MNFSIIKHNILMLLAMFLLFACQDKSTIKTPSPLIVNTFTVQDAIDIRYRTFKGTVVPADLTPLSFRLEGELDGISVRTGQKVKKGQLLAQLDDSKLKQQFADAQAKYQLAKKQLQRGQKLSTTKMISKSALDELISTAQMTEVNFKIAENNLKYSQLTAPFSGYIAEVPKQSFESVKPGETILTLYRDDIVRVHIDISNSVLAAINPDMNKQKQKVTTTFSNDPQIYTLHYYQHTSEPASGESAFQLWLEMPQVKPRILPGTSANINVDMLQASLHVVSGYQVPMTVLDAGNKDNEFYIWKFIDGKVHKQVVDVIQINKEGAIIKSGLKNGDVLVSSNLRKLRENAIVTATEKE